MSDKKTDKIDWKHVSDLEASDLFRERTDGVYVIGVFRKRGKVVFSRFIQKLREAKLEAEQLSHDDSCMGCDVYRHSDGLLEQVARYVNGKFVKVGQPPR